MLNELLLPLREYFGFLNLFEYITFRAGASAILALLISFIFGPFVVKKLINLQKSLSKNFGTLNQLKHFIIIFQVTLKILWL